LAGLFVLVAEGIWGLITFGPFVLGSGVHVFCGLLVGL